MRGIKFNVWLDFFLFALGILLILGILQFSLIRPYYRNNKLDTIEQVAEKIQTYIINNESGSESSIRSAFQIAVNNNVCVLIFNEQGKIVYNADGLGASCIFSQAINIDGQIVIPEKSGLMMKEILSQQSGEFSEILVNSKSNQEMILYGKQVDSNLGNLYLYVNSSLEPVDSIMTFFKEQYVFYTFIILVMSVGISLFISSGLSKPIVKMKCSADNLAKAEYEKAHFEGSYFKEIDDLAITLNEATEKLAKVDELRKDLIANMSHDIKTPLTMIKAYAEMIRDISGDKPEKRGEHVEVIIKEVDYLDNLVTDMQELSRMQSGNYQLNMENFDLVEKVWDMISLLKGVIDENHLELHVLSEDSIIAYGDSIKLGQVIYNFLSNAIKHSEEKKQINIRIFKTEEGVRFEIEDEAGGIPEESIPYIWDRYYKIDKTFQRAQMGTGLGLAIVKAVLDNHNALYGVHSEEGKGSIFWFELVQENAV